MADQDDNVPPVPRSFFAIFYLSSNHVVGGHAMLTSVESVPFYRVIVDRDGDRPPAIFMIPLASAIFELASASRIDSLESLSR